MLEGTVELIAQIFDMDVNGVRPRLLTALPGIFDEGGARDHIAGMFHKAFEEREFFSAEADGYTVACHGAHLAVQQQAAYLKLTRQRLMVWDRAPKRAQTGFEFPETERLGEVIVGACIEQIDLGQDFCHAAEDENRCFGGYYRAMQTANPVHIRKFEIEYDRAVLLIPGFEESLGAVQGYVDIVSSRAAPKPALWPGCCHHPPPGASEAKTCALLSRTDIK